MITFIRTFVALALLVPTSLFSQAPVEFNFDFRDGTHEWSAVFADYPPGEDSFHELEGGLRQLPVELGVAGTGFLLHGNNHSDDLMMLLRRKLGPDDGIEPGAVYRLDYVIEFASNAQSECAGVGGSPGDGVYLRAGARRSNRTRFSTRGAITCA